MRQTTGTRRSPGEKIVKDIKRATRKHYSSESKKGAGWHQCWPKLRESLAHLVGFIMRRVVCDASVVFRVSFV